MVALTLSPAAKVFEDNSYAKLHATPHAGQGPVTLMFVPIGTHPGARLAETFAAAAVLTQNGKVLATFQAIAFETFTELCNMRRLTEDDRNALLQLPRLSTYEHLSQAFGLFYLACWKLTWDALKPEIPSGFNGNKFGNHLTEKGYLQVLHSGLFLNLEQQFFHASMPSYDMKVEHLGDEHAYDALCHPYGIMPLHTLFTGMGYRPNLEEHVAALGLKAAYRNPVKDVMNLHSVYQAAKHRDPRLEAFRF